MKCLTNEHLTHTNRKDRGMNKRIIAVFMCMILLCGCGNKPIQQDSPLAPDNLLSHFGDSREVLEGIFPDEELTIPDTKLHSTYTEDGVDYEVTLLLSITDYDDEYFQTKEGNMDGIRYETRFDKNEIESAVKLMDKLIGDAQDQYGDRSTHFMAINQYLKLNDPASEIVEHEKAIYSEEWILSDINYYMLYKISICCWEEEVIIVRQYSIDISAVEIDLQ